MTEFAHGQDSESRPLTNKQSCPQCGLPALAIAYGLPSQDDFEDPQFYSGGCIVTEDQPNWACAECGIEFG